MPDYLRALARTPEAVQNRPASGKAPMCNGGTWVDSAVLQRLERFLVFVDDRIAQNERVALRMANEVIARAARKSEARR